MDAWLKRAPGNAAKIAQPAASNGDAPSAKLKAEPKIKEKQKGAYIGAPRSLSRVYVAEDLCRHGKPALGRKVSTAKDR